MKFFETFEHAAAKAIEKIKSLGAGELPKVQAAVAAIQKGIPVAEVVKPKTIWGKIWAGVTVFSRFAGLL